MSQDLLLVNSEVPVEDIEHLAFHPTDVPILENAGTPRPDHVLHHPIVEVLGNERAESIR